MAASHEVSVPEDVMNLVEAREAARKDKDYKAADRLRVLTMRSRRCWPWVS